MLSPRAPYRVNPALGQYTKQNLMPLNQQISQRHSTVILLLLLFLHIASEFGAPALIHRIRTCYDNPQRAPQSQTFKCHKSLSVNPDISTTCLSPCACVSEHLQTEKTGVPETDTAPDLLRNESPCYIFS